MKHHHEEEVKNDDSIYYLVAMFTGIFVGLIVDRGFVYPILGAVLGLLSAGLFIKTLVRGRDNV